MAMEEELGRCEKFFIYGTQVDGVYERTGVHHGKDMWSKKDDGEQEFVMLFWDDRDGPDWNGWWLVAAANKDMVYARHANAATATPPTFGWLSPWNSTIVNQNVYLVPGAPVRPGDETQFNTAVKIEEMIHKMEHMGELRTVLRYMLKSQQRVDDVQHVVDTVQQVLEEQDVRINQMSKDLYDIKMALGPDFVKRQRVQSEMDAKKVPLYVRRSTVRADGRTRSTNVKLY